MKPRSELADYDYELPRHLIAQHPLVRRTDARLLVVDRKTEAFSHHHIRDLPVLLARHDCLVINDTRVVPARLVGRRTSSGGHWEGLFLSADEQGNWRLLAKSRGKLAAGETVTLVDRGGADDVRLRLLLKEPDGSWIVRPEVQEETLALLERIGRVPLPPYIRDGEMTDADRTRYQTVFAAIPGAVAAPTAGLHFTTQLMESLANRGIDTARVTLHVGLDTFRPITADSLEDHTMHSEWGEIAPQAVSAIERTKEHSGRVVAVGTTTVRVLETAAAGGTIKPWQGRTDLFIRPGFEFRIVDALLTNFHLPRTTLLVLVSTFAGRALIQRAYDEAIREEYRFYSYGDAMLIL